MEARLPVAVVDETVLGELTKCFLSYPAALGNLVVLSSAWRKLIATLVHAEEGILAGIPMSFLTVFVAGGDRLATGTLPEVGNCSDKKTHRCVRPWRKR